MDKVDTGNGQKKAKLEYVELANRVIKSMWQYWTYEQIVFVPHTISDCVLQLFWIVIAPERGKYYNLILYLMSLPEVKQCVQLTQ